MVTLSRVAIVFCLLMFAMNGSIVLLGASGISDQLMVTPATSDAEVNEKSRLAETQQVRANSFVAFVADILLGERLQKIIDILFLLPNTVKGLPLIPDFFADWILRPLQLLWYAAIFWIIANRNV